MAVREQVRSLSCLNDHVCAHGGIWLRSPLEANVVSWASVCTVQSRRLEPDHIDVVAAHPGMATTDHFGKADTEHKLSSLMIETWAKSLIGQTKEAGAVALEYAGVSPDVNGKADGFGWHVSLWMCIFNNISTAARFLHSSDQPTGAALPCTSGLMSMRASAVASRLTSVS